MASRKSKGSPQGNRGKWLESVIEWQWKRNALSIYRIPNVIKSHRGETWREKTPFDFMATLKQDDPGAANRMAAPIVFDSKESRDGKVWAGKKPYQASLYFHQALSLQQWRDSGAYSGIILGDHESAHWVPLAVLLDAFQKNSFYQLDKHGKAVLLGSYSEKWELGQIAWMHTQFTLNSRPALRVENIQAFLQDRT